MRRGSESDYRAPFADVRGEETWQARRRVIHIGREALLAWWERVKNDTNPATYGATGHEFASGVAYMLANGGPSEFTLRCTDNHTVRQVEAWRILSALPAAGARVSGCDSRGPWSGVFQRLASGETGSDGNPLLECVIDGQGTMLVPLSAVA